MSSTLANSSMYLKQVFFFDIHPALGKLLLAGAGYMADTNVTFPFERIRDGKRIMFFLAKQTRNMFELCSLVKVFFCVWLNCDDKAVPTKQ